MALKSWITSACDPETDFPIQNLPYGVFACAGSTRIGVAIGDAILDLRRCVRSGLLEKLPSMVAYSCAGPQLNDLMGLGPEAWALLRQRITDLLREDANEETRRRVALMLLPQRDAVMQLPAQIGDYTDFYASIHHATRVGKLVRPENPLLPNYKHIPIGYHGRASSIVVSGCEVRRPCGQLKPPPSPQPEFAAARSLDYELEVGVFIGPGNRLGEPVPIRESGKHIFGLCLLNDWSARDMQTWEYQPLGPFLAKNFATTISPWVVTMEALTPYAVPMAPRPEGDPAPLAYLSTETDDNAAIDLTVEVYLQSERMRADGFAPVRVSRGNLCDLYWSITQLVTHHASNGCNLRPGDLLGTGTISGPEEGSEGCLLEMRHRAEPLALPTGETRGFLEDGDEIILRAFAQNPGSPRIGFGTCAGRVVGAHSAQ